MNYKCKIFYNLESKQNKDNTKLLYLNMSYGYSVYNSKKEKYDYKNLRLSTQCSFLSEYWDKNTSRLNSVGTKNLGIGINNTIGKIEGLAIFHYNQFRQEYNKKPSPDELKQLIFIDLDRAKKENKHVIITDYITKLIARKTSLPPTSNEHWKESTKTQYENLNRIIKLYETNANICLTFGEITEEIYWDFFKVINDLYHKEAKG